MEVSGKSRSKPFTDDEFLILINLINYERRNLENKKTDATTLANKKAAWRRIESDFNSKATVQRTWVQLRKCWENWKSRQRKERALESNSLRDDTDSRASYFLEVDPEPEIGYQQTVNGSSPIKSGEYVEDTEEAVSSRAEVVSPLFSNEELKSLVGHSPEQKTSPQPQTENKHRKLRTSSLSLSPPKCSTVKRQRTSSTIVPKELDSLLQEEYKRKEDLHKLRMQHQNLLIEAANFECREKKALADAAQVKLESDIYLLRERRASAELVELKFKLFKRRNNIAEDF